MTAVDIKISAINSSILTKCSRTEKRNRVHNDNIAYCIEHYVSAGQLVSLSVTKNGDADVYSQAILRLSDLFNVEECMFGATMMILIKSAKIKLV